MSTDADDFAVRLRAARARGVAPPTGSGQGMAFAAQVRVFATGGRLERVELEPQLLRLAPDELGAYVVEAVNAALAADVPAGDESADGPVDPLVLDDALRTAMESGSAMMRTISESLGDVMFRLRERTGMSGDPGTQGLASVLDEAGDLLRVANGDRPDGAEPAEQTGAGADGAVVATVRAGPRVVEVGIAGRALRMGAYALAEEIVTAVNDGLDRLGEATAAAAETARPVTPERIRDVQDASLAHMRAYTGALRALLGSVGGPPAPTNRERSDDDG